MDAFALGRRNTFNHDEGPVETPAHGLGHRDNARRFADAAQEELPVEAGRRSARKMLRKVGNDTQRERASGRGGVNSTHGGGEGKQVAGHTDVGGPVLLDEPLHKPARVNVGADVFYERNIRKSDKAVGQAVRACALAFIGRGNLAVAFAVIGRDDSRRRNRPA